MNNCKIFHLSKRSCSLLAIALACLAAGIVAGQSEQSRTTSVLLKKRETLNSIPKEYGRLVAVDRRDADTIMYFEASDGTIRFVTVIYGIDYGSLKFNAVTVPRN